MTRYAPLMAPEPRVENSSTTDGEAFPSALARAAHWGGLFAGPLLAIVVYLLLRTLATGGASDAGAAAATSGIAAATLSHAGIITLAIGAWMAAWWVTEPVSSAVTSILPLALFPIFGVLTFKQAAAPYVDDLVVLFFAGFVLGRAVEKWGLHQRFALWTLRLFGTRPAMVVLGVMCATALVSMWVSNTATAVMMTPIALSLASMADRAGDSGRPSAAGASSTGSTGGTGGDGPHAWSPTARRRFSIALLLGVSYGASIGGMGTPIGTPPNLQLSAYAKDVLGREIGFGTWMLIAAPIVVIALSAAWGLIVLLHRTGGARLAGNRATLGAQLRALGPLSRAGWVVAIVFVLAAVAWIARVPATNGINDLLREQHARHVAAKPTPATDSPDSTAQPSTAHAAPAPSGSASASKPVPFVKREFIGDAGIGLIAALVLFALPIHKRRESFVLSWHDCAHIPWGTLLLFGGGLSLAAAMKATGADAFLGGLFAHLQGLPTPIFFLLLALGVVALSEVASNTALAAAIIPILGAWGAGTGTGTGAGSGASGGGMDPLLLLFVATFAASCGFALPVATPPNAIVYATGRVPLRNMLRSGLVADIVCAVIVVAVFVLLGETLMRAAGLMQ